MGESYGGFKCTRWAGSEALKPVVRDVQTLFRKEGWVELYKHKDGRYFTPTVYWLVVEVRIRYRIHGSRFCRSKDRVALYTSTLT